MAEGSRGRAILEPIVGVSISEVSATSGRGRGRGRTTTIGRGMSKLESQGSRPQARARVFAITRQ